jgi:hypothetical protein
LASGRAASSSPTPGSPSPSGPAGAQRPAEPRRGAVTALEHEGGAASRAASPAIARSAGVASKPGTASSASSAVVASTASFSRRWRPFGGEGVSCLSPGAMRTQPGCIRNGAVTCEKSNGMAEA